MMNETELTLVDRSVVFAIVSAVIGLLYLLTYRWRHPRITKAKMGPEQKKFLEAALDNDPERAQGKPYTWEELQRDLHDGKLTFEEIWEKAGGVFPERPKEPEPLTAIPSDGERKARTAWLQAWFLTRTAEKGSRKIVPPPPPSYVTIIKWRNRRGR